MGCSQSIEVEQTGNKKHRLNENLIIEKKRDFRRDYQVMKQIGKGSISNIYLVRKKTYSMSLGSVSGFFLKDSIESGEFDNGPPKNLYALKEIDTQLIEPALIKEMRNEIALMKTIDHPNILKAYEVYEDKKGHISIVMEVCWGGDLFSRAPFTEDQARNIICKLVEVIHYLHSRGIMHRDLKPENIMFDTDGADSEIKLIDFGLAIKYFKDKKKLSAQVGTIYTMSPETLKGSYDYKADLWSVGVIAYIILSGKKPFWGKDIQDTAKQVMCAEYNFNGKEWKQISQEAKDFIHALLQVDPKIRYSASQALESPWLRSVTKISPSDLSKEFSSVMMASFESLPGTLEFRKLAMNMIARKASTQEIVELRKIFHAIDVDHDGTITCEELKKGLGSKFSDKDIENWFEQADLDGSGSIDYTEFLAATLETKNELQMESITEAFALFDREGKGYISPENLRQVLGVAENSQYIDQLIVEADANGDGKISFREFRDVMVNRNNEKRASLVIATAA